MRRAHGDPKAMDAAERGELLTSKGGATRGKAGVSADGSESESLVGGGKKDTWANLGRIFREARPFAGQLALGTLFLSLSSVTLMSLPYFAGKVIDSVAEGSNGDVSEAHAKRDLNRVVSQLLVVAGMLGVFAGFRSYLFNSASERVVASLRNKLYRSLVHQELGFYDVSMTGDLISRVVADTLTLKNAATTNLSMAMRGSVNLTVGISMMFYSSWRLTLLALAVTPAASVIVIVYGRRIRKLSRETSAAQAWSAAVASDSLGAVKTLKAFGREAAEERHFAAAVDKALQLGVKTAVAQGAFYGVAASMAFGVVGVIIWYGGTQVLDGHMTVGALQAFILYALTLGANLGLLSSVYLSLVNALGASERVFQLLDRQPELPMEHATGRPFEGKEAVGAELRDVWFAYPSRPDVEVLCGVNFEVEPATTAALVGGSGGGKSTVVSLVERFYDPNKGTVLLGGVDVRLVDPVHLHATLGLVSQEPVMFARSLRENLAFARDGITEPEMAAALEQANASSFVSSYPEGLDTQVGERGVQLSGGQKQRVAIARALLTNPKVLLLDEATSALDAESEAAVVEALDRMMVGRTAIVVAHRLSTVRNADRVVVLARGVVAEMGTHDSLLDAGGAYHSLVQRQLTGPARSASAASLGPAEAC
mmetsp:Transcript_9897/g.34495  ORF Transcript_9897/g.34495 Transcript_9897/m.34495 type:complete len:653 (+) Transcript_9897:100-2058(+)